MHKLIEYICDELDEIERKADKEQKLSMAEIQYADTLAHMKKNLLKSEEMMDEDGEYSMNNGSYARDRSNTRGRSYARGGRRGGANQYGSYAMEGGYSRGSTEGMIEEIRDLMHDAPNEQVRQEFQRFLSKLEHM